MNSNESTIRNCLKKEENNTINSLVKSSGLKKSVVRYWISKLIKTKLVNVDKRTKEHKYSLSKDKKINSSQGNYFKKIKDHYEKHCMKYRFLIVLLFTLWLHFFIISPHPIGSEQLRVCDNGGECYLEIPRTVNISDLEFNGNLESIIWKLIRSVPDIDQICFKDNGSYLKYGDIIDYESLTVEMSYNEGEFFEVKGEECHTISKNADKLTFRWRFLASVDYKDIIENSEPQIIFSNETEYIAKMKGFTIHPDVETYMKIGLLQQTLKFILLFFSSGALLWAWSRAYFIIRYGFR